MAIKRIMQGKYAISASLAECFITVDGRRINLMQAMSIQATAEKQKTEIGVLGSSGKKHKSTSWVGSGTLKLYYNQSVLRKYLKDFKDTGLDFYFEIQVTNEDPTSELGRQTTILKECNLDKMDIALFDVDEEVLTEEIDFTFDDWEMPEEFKQLEGME